MGRVKTGDTAHDQGIEGKDGGKEVDLGTGATATEEIETIGE